MVKLRGDTQTMDLLSWEPAPIVEAFEPVRVRCASLRAKIAQAVSESMKYAGKSRAILAVEMSDWLGEDVTENMLNAYASEAREDHSIPYLRLLALVHVTGDVRLLQIGAELMGHSVIEDKYLSWVDVGRLADHKETIDKEFAAARRVARMGVK